MKQKNKPNQKDQNPGASEKVGFSFKKNQKLIIAVGSVAVLALAVFSYRSLYPNRIVATVGDYKITQKEKVYRDKLQRIYYPNDPKDYGLDQLIRAYTYAQILKNNGMEITEAVLRAEDMRIHQNSKAPEVLAKIRKIFKGDEEAYKRVFILPTYAERTIYYDFFTKSSVTQAKSLARVQEVLKRLETEKLSPGELAHIERLNSKMVTLSRENGIEWEEPKDLKKEAVSPKLPPGAPKSADTAQVPAEMKQKMDGENRDKALETATYWIENVLPRMKPGEVLKEPVDFGESWLVVKYHKPLSKKKFQLEAVFIPKDNYNDWLEAEKAKVIVH